MTAIKAKTDNLPASPAAVGSQMTLTGTYDAAKVAASQASVDGKPTLSQIEASTVLAKDATVAKAAALSVTDGKVTAIKSQTDNLPPLPAASGDAMTLTPAAVDAVWDEPLAGHATPGTAGKALVDAGASSDPWTTPLPGSYTAGQAGKIVGDNLNAKVGDVKAQTDKLPSDPASNTQVATRASQTSVDGKPTLSQIESSTVLAKQAELLRVLGLSFENYGMDQVVTADGKMQSCRLRCYDDPAHVGTDLGIIAEYDVTAAYDPSTGFLISYQVRRA